MSLETKTSYGPWKVLGKLGRGGMGEVLLVQRAAPPQQRAALKLLPVARNAEERRSRQREQALLDRIEHPNIARLLDFGETAEGHPYLVLELVEGERIDEYCQKRNLGLEARLKLFLGVCGAVAAAHQQLIIHCDLKPSNVLVRSEDGIVKLLDFGLARQVTEEMSATTLVSSYSTWAYASPEQLAGRPLSTASDVYSLGVLLFELLTDSRLFAATDPGFLGHIEARRGPPRASSKLIPGKPESWRRALRTDLDPVITKALQPEPEQRYGSVGELAEDLEAFLAGLPVKVRQKDFWYTWRCRVRRNIGPISAAAILILTAVSATLALALQARTLAVERDSARHQEKVANETSAFLLGSLRRVADAGNSGPPTVRTLAGVAAAELDYQLLDVPLVRAEVLGMLSTHYRFAGNLGQAQFLLEEALGIWDAQLGGQDPEVLRCMNTLAIILMEAGNIETGCRMANEVATRAKRSGDERIETIGHSSLGYCAFKERRFQDAEVLATKAAETAQKIHSFGSLDYEEEIDNLFIIKFNLGRDAELEALLRHLIAARTHRRQGRQDPWTQSRRFWLASTLIERGALDEAEKELRILLDASQDQASGSIAGDHVAESWLHLAEIRRRRGDPTAALQMAKKAAESLRRDLPPDSPRHRLARRIEALAMFDAGFQAEARGILRQLQLEVEEDRNTDAVELMEIRNALLYVDPPSPTEG